MSIQLKRGLTADIDSNYILKPGQLGIDMMKGVNQKPLYSDSTPFELKIGDGTTKWGNLPSIKPYKLATEHADGLLSSYYYSWLYNNSWNYQETKIQWLEHEYNQYTYQLNFGNAKINLTTGSKPSYYWKLEGNTFKCGDYGFTIATADDPISYIYVRNLTQTSDISAKTNIHHLDDGAISLIDDYGNEQIGITNNDVIEFVKTISPVTFDYKDTVESHLPESRQLGLIANEIEDTKLFQYIGCRMNYDGKDAEYDDAGNITKEAVPAGSTLGLKPIPLAVAALTCCRQLLKRVEELESKVN